VTVGTEERLRRELEESFRNRAHLYRLMLEELEAELGPARAETVMARALERRGREVAAALFAGLPPEPRAVAGRFLAPSPDGGRLFPHAVEHGAGATRIAVHRCPLKDAWTGSGLPPARIAALCRLAGAFDRGLFEAAGLGFANDTWAEGRDGCCRITLTRRAGAAD
jgi:hypothetical protein